MFEPKGSRFDRVTWPHEPLLVDIVATNSAAEKPSLKSSLDLVDVLPGQNTFLAVS